MRQHSVEHMLHSTFACRAKRFQFACDGHGDLLCLIEWAARHVFWASKCIFNGCTTTVAVKFRIQCLGLGL